MRIRLLVNDQELIIQRDFITARLTYTLDGKKGTLQKALDLDAQFVISRNLEYEIPVGTSIVKVIHSRPRIFPAFREHTFTILKDGEVIKVAKGK